MSHAYDKLIRSNLIEIHFLYTCSKVDIFQVGFLFSRPMSLTKTCFCCCCFHSSGIAICLNSESNLNGFAISVGGEKSVFVEVGNEIK